MNIVGIVVLLGWIIPVYIIEVKPMVLGVVVSLVKIYKKNRQTT